MNRQRIRLAISVVMVFMFPLVFYYLSPYLVLMGAAEGVIAGDVVLFVGLFIMSLFFGRAWCGWICPAGATQELCSKVNGKAFNGKKRNLIKYFIWAPWITLIVIIFVQSGGVKAINPLYQTWNGISVQDVTSAIMFAAIAGAIAAFALVAGKRAACHTICWMAPFLVMGARIKNRAGYPSLHLEADKTQCVKCQQCIRHCPMSLNVTEMVQKQNMTNTECILCGSCIDTCPKKAIKYSFSKPKEKEP